MDLNLKALKQNVRAQNNFKATKGRGKLILLFLSHLFFNSQEVSQVLVIV